MKMRDQISAFLARMKKSSETSGPESAIALAFVGIVVAILAVMFGLQTLVWINAKHWASVDPWMADTPKLLTPDAGLVSEPPLLDKNGKPAKPPQMRAYDYEFTAPWPGNYKTTPAVSFVQFQFDSGQVIAFLDPGAEIDVVRQMKSGETVLCCNQFQNVFGDQAPNTNYDLYRLVYSASPKDISPFMRSQDAFRANVLLIWKLSFGFDMQPGIHSH